MRQSLEQLANRIDRIDIDNIYAAINEIKENMITILALIDKALPEEVEPD